MSKRGLGQVITYFIVAFAIVAVIFIGFKGVAKIMDKTCEAEIAKFQIDFRELGKILRYGDVEEYTKQVPCDVDEIYFFDLKKEINAEPFKEMPFLADSLESGVRENVFLVKDDEIIDSFYAGNISMEYPNYICFLPKFGNINFFLEGKGRNVNIYSGCFQPECTYSIVNATDEEAAGIIYDAKEFGCDECPKTELEVDEEWDQFVQTQQNAEIFRKFEYCKEEGKNTQSLENV